MPVLSQPDGNWSGEAGYVQVDSVSAWVHFNVVYEPGLTLLAPNIGFYRLLLLGPSRFLALRALVPFCVGKNRWLRYASIYIMWILDSTWIVNFVRESDLFYG